MKAGVEMKQRRMSPLVHLACTVDRFLPLKARTITRWLSTGPIKVEEYLIQVMMGRLWMV